MSSMTKSAQEYNPFPKSDSGKSQKPPRRRIWSIVGISVGLFVILVGIVATLGWFFSAVPAIEGEKYYIAIYQQDYSLAYNYLTADMKAKISEQDFIKKAQQLDASEGKITSYTYTSYPFGDPGKATEQVKRAHGSTYTVHFELHQENGQWKISNFDRI